VGQRDIPVETGGFAREFAVKTRGKSMALSHEPQYTTSKVLTALSGNEAFYFSLSWWLLWMLESKVLRRTEVVGNFASTHFSSVCRIRH
jgi:hypothetical protein